MAGPYGTEESGFESALRYLGRLGYTTRNLLTGNLEGAGRQIADIAGDTVDAFLPGDWIPEFSRRGQDGQPNDYTEGSDLLAEWGVANLEPGLGKLAADVGVGLLTDPLTYLGVGAVGAGAKAATGAQKALTLGVPFSKTMRTAIPGSEKLVAGVSQAAEALTPPVVKTALEGAGRLGRRLTGGLKVAPEFKETVEAARAMAGKSAAAQAEALRPILASLTPEEGKALFLSIQNAAPDAAGAWKTLVPEPVTDAAYDAASAVRDLTGVGPDAAAIRQANDLTQIRQADTVDPVSSMLGAPDRGGVGLRPTPLPNVIDTASMRQGGLVPPLERTAASELPEAFNTWKTYEDQTADILKGLEAQGLQVTPELAAAADQWVRYAGGQFKELVDRGAFQAPLGRDLLRESPQYAQRMFTRPDDDFLASLRSRSGASAPKATKARTIRQGEDLADYLNENPTVSLETDLAKVAGSRAGQQASMLSRATAAQGMVKEYAKRAEAKIQQAASGSERWQYLPDAEKAKLAGLSEAEAAAYSARWAPLYAAGDQSTDLAKAANLIIDDVAKSGDRETAEALANVYRGIAPREGLFKILAGANRLFKRFATAGAFIPRLNFSIRNVTTGSGSQVLANPEARGALGAYAKATPQILLRSLDDGLEELTGTRLFRTENEYAAVNQALRESGGVVSEAAKRIKDPLMKEMFERGVITDGFVVSEDLGRALATKGPKKWLTDLRDWPAAIAKGTEQRMRGTVYKALREQGMEADQAAQVVRDTFFDYNVGTSLNRAARDVIPFFQFTSKAIPQSLRLMREQPAVAGAIRPFYTQDSADRPVYPYMADQPLIPMGEDEQGGQQYLGSFGLPIETLGQLPNPSAGPWDLLDQTRQGVVGQMSPLLKTAIAAAGGQDPHFGSAFGSYDKVPELLQAMGLPERGEVGRVYNLLAGTGAIQPLASPVQYLSGIMDDRKTLAESALSGLTGFRLQSVDEDKAIQQLTERALRRDPSVQQYRTFYKNEKDPETKALMDALREAKANLKKKREAEG